VRTRFSPAIRRRSLATIPLVMFAFASALPAAGSSVQDALGVDTAPADGPDSVVGSTTGPPALPAVPGSRLDILADPQQPGPGESTQLTVTVSGSRDRDRYAVTGATVDLGLTVKPDDGSTLSATSVNTDITGSVTVKLTLSRTRGRTIVKAASGTISNQMLIDTLAGAQASAGRARHSSTITLAPAPAVKPEYLEAAAVLVLLVSFLLPYRGRLSSGRKTPRPRQSAVPGGSPGRPRSAKS
jgi:hypothetical protein